MTVLVTGGAGYIGSHTVLTLLRKGFDVFVYDNLSKGHEESCRRIGARLIIGDIRDNEKLDRVLAKHDITHVIHFAGVSLVGESMTDPLKYYEMNLHGTESLLRSLVKAHVKGIVFSSSAAVYGEPETLPIRENDTTSPTNVYGETKLGIEKMLEWTRRAHGLNYVCLRYFNAAGADFIANIGEDHRPETHLIPLVLQAAMGTNRSIKLFGKDYPTRDGTCLRDYIHITDLAEGHVKALSKLDKSESGIYNLGTGQGVSVGEIIAAAEKVTGKKIKVETAPRREGDPAVLVASAEKAMKELDWVSEYPDIEVIIDSAWKWHKDNPDGFRPYEIISD
jgi:UDP-glucose 4-epimerase